MGGGGGTSHENSDKQGGKEESQTPFLAAQLIQYTPQEVGFRVEQLQLGNEEEEIYDHVAN